MLHLNSPKQAHDWCKTQRKEGLTIGYVPTMGSLHEGHLSLIQKAREENDKCCVSIFVNPLQFNAIDDFESYPRNLENDINILKDNGCSMSFAGNTEDFFTELSSGDDIPIKSAGHFGSGLEERHRPGHLNGVRTIVDRLFKIVGPSKAYFGEKDFQQCLVVSDLALEIGYPTVVICPTVRECTGLAISSRNALLSVSQKKQAEGIFKTLSLAKNLWRSGKRDPVVLSKNMLEMLEKLNIQAEYAEIRDPKIWTPGTPPKPLLRAQALIAVKIGNVRLIDNMRLDDGLSV